MSIIAEKSNICGKRYASGFGLHSLFDLCSENHWTSDNTVLVVPDLADSYWEIYELVSK